MVQRDNRWNEFLERQDAVAETLVVVHKIEFASALGEMTLDASAERRWFTKGAS
jgi:hypothetical protein